MEIQFQAFLQFLLAAAQWAAIYTGWFTAGERNPDVHWVRGWLDHGSGLDGSKKRKGCWCYRKSNYDFSVTEPVAHSVYRLSYAGSSSLLFLILLVPFILPSSPSCYSPSFLYLLLFAFSLFSFSTCPFHVLIVLLLLFPFSSRHSSFLIPFFQSHNFLSSL